MDGDDTGDRGGAAPGVGLFEVGPKSRPLAWPPIRERAGDTVVQPNSVTKLVEKLRTQKHITIHHDEIARANHFFENEIDDMMHSVDNYLDMRLSPDSPIK